MVAEARSGNSRLRQQQQLLKLSDMPRQIAQVLAPVSAVSDRPTACKRLECQLVLHIRRPASRRASRGIPTDSPGKTPGTRTFSSQRSSALHPKEQKVRIVNHNQHQSPSFPQKRPPSAKTHACLWKTSGSAWGTLGEINESALISCSDQYCCPTTFSSPRQWPSQQDQASRIPCHEPGHAHRCG